MCLLYNTAAASQSWVLLCAVTRILDIPEEGEVAIVGTLYKDMKLKPSILDEYVKDRALSQQLGEWAAAAELCRNRDSRSGCLLCMLSFA